jgi:hypothetical protein
VSVAPGRPTTSSRSASPKGHRRDALRQATEMAAAVDHAEIEETAHSGGRRDQRLGRAPTGSAAGASQPYLPASRRCPQARACSSCMRCSQTSLERSTLEPTRFIPNIARSWFSTLFSTFAPASAFARSTIRRAAQLAAHCGSQRDAARTPRRCRRSQRRGTPPRPPSRPGRCVSRTRGTRPGRRRRADCSRGRAPSCAAHCRPRNWSQNANALPCAVTRAPPSIFIALPPCDRRGLEEPAEEDRVAGDGEARQALALLGRAAVRHLDAGARVVDHEVVADLGAAILAGVDVDRAGEAGGRRVHHDAVAHDAGAPFGRITWMPCVSGVALAPVLGSAMRRMSLPASCA